MADIILKKAASEDILAMLGVERKLAGMKTCYAITTKEKWRKEMGNSTVYAIVMGGKIIGDAAFEMKGKDHAYLTGLMIDPDFQNRGIGRQVLAQLIEELKAVERVDLAVHPHNSPAVGLYLHFGFIIESWKDNYFGDGQPRIIMARYR